MRVSKKYLAPSIYSYPYWRLKSNIRFYKGVFCLFGHPHDYSVFSVNVNIIFKNPKRKSISDLSSHSEKF